MSAYPYQSTGHDASISAAPGDEPDTITVEIVIGDHAESRITMWAEDFTRMATTALGQPPLANHVCAEIGHVWKSTIASTSYTCQGCGQQIRKQDPTTQEDQ